jgi:hypothetical protein
MAIKKRCLRCLKPMRNDGTEQNPHWVCNNQNCVRYVPPVEPQEQTNETNNE